MKLTTIFSNNWISDVRIGILHDSGLNLEKEFMEIREIYDLKSLVS